MNVKNPKFEMYLDKAGEHRFRLKAKNGQIIATSEGYKAKKAVLMASKVLGLTQLQKLSRKNKIHTAAGL